MEGAMEGSKRKANGERRGKRKRANGKVFGRGGLMVRLGRWKGEKLQLRLDSEQLSQSAPSLGRPVS